MVFDNLPDIIEVHVRAHAHKTKYRETLSDGTLKIELNAPKEGGKANRELIKFLEKETGDNWKIIFGKTSSRKKLKRIKKLL
ncbi:hypothetical protein CSB09_01225 [Candidatus Gracilibacteria bacterium]|nr:MAG: hypothetical protein CSB09_01225 [Candidatus Gracilibacteria bacterium]